MAGGIVGSALEDYQHMSDFSLHLHYSAGGFQSKLQWSLGFNKPPPPVQQDQLTWVLGTSKPGSEALLCGWQGGGGVMIKT